MLRFNSLLLILSILQILSKFLTPMIHQRPGRKIIGQDLQEII